MSEVTYSDLDVEAAMCLWEAVLDLLADVPERAGDPIAEKLRECVDGIGYMELRSRIADLAHECSVEYSRLDYDGSFDWDFCPAFIHRKVIEGYFD